MHPCVHHSIITVVKIGKQPKCHSPDVAYIKNEILVIKKEILPFGKKKTDLEGILLNEIRRREDKYHVTTFISSVQSLSRVWLFAAPWTAAHQASLSITSSQSWLKLVHRVGDAIQPSHPLSSPSSPALSLSQRQCFFKWVSSSHQVAEVLEFQLQHQSIQWTPGTDLL